MKQNVILIGMPTAGKSTVGVVLAKMLGCDYVDTDLLIQKQQGCRLEPFRVRAAAPLSLSSINRN